MTQQQGRGENVLITGASSGIGLATALYLAGKGYSVVGTSRSEQGLAALRDEAPAKHLRVEEQPQQAESVQVAVLGGVFARTLVVPQVEGHHDEDLGDIFLVWQTTGSGLVRSLMGA